MAYASVENVQSLMGLTFNQATRPTHDEVEQFVDDIAADLDGVAQAAGYDVPVTSTQAMVVLRKYNTFGAAVSAWHAGYLTDDEPPRVAYWREQYDAFIARLRRGEQQLPGIDTEEGADDPAFGIASAIPRDTYWTRQESLENE